MPFEASPELRRFIWAQGLAIGSIAADKLIADFVQQMREGKQGNSSLAMLDSHLQIQTPSPGERSMLVIDAGGSHLRCALAHSRMIKGQLAISLENISHQAMPGSTKALSKEAFFQALFEAIQPYLDGIQHIGFCFSYPCEISSSADGKLLRWTKEVQANQVEGCWIGKELNQVIVNHGFDSKHITLLNDTVAALLANTLEQNTQKCLTHIGLILGTGTNCAFSEGKTQIIINIESGSYDGANNAVVDQLLDQHCEDPGHYCFEKKIAGKYLGSLCLQLFNLAGEQGLLSEACSDSIHHFLREHHHHLETERLNEILAGSFEQFDYRDEKDQEIVKFLCEAVIERAALLTAIQLTAIARYQMAEKSEFEGNVHIGVEGSTYYKLSAYKARIKHYLYCLNHNRDLHFYFRHTDNASLIGAAIAALGRFQG